MFSYHQRRYDASIPTMESGRSLIPHEIEAYQVQHLPIVKA
jgi:hypothetical protein